MNQNHDHYHLCHDRQHQNHDYQNDVDLLIINEEEEGVVGDKLGVDQRAG